MGRGNQVLTLIKFLWQKFFDASNLKFEISGMSKLRLLVNTYCLQTNTISCWNSCWGYILTSGVCRWHEDRHVMAFPGKTYWCQTPRFKCQPWQNLWSWSVDVSNSAKEQYPVCRPEYIFRKSHVIKLMTLTNRSFQRVSPM